MIEIKRVATFAMPLLYHNFVPLHVMNACIHVGLRHNSARSALRVYTNRGVGVTAPPIRFNCRPEVALLTLARESYKRSVLRNSVEASGNKVRHPGYPRSSLSPLSRMNPCCRIRSRASLAASCAACCLLRPVP